MRMFGFCVFTSGDYEENEAEVIIGKWSSHEHCVALFEIVLCKKGVGEKKESRRGGRILIISWECLFISKTMHKQRGR